VIRILVLASALPGLFWDQAPGTAAKLKAGGIARVLVPPARVAAWRAAGVEAAAFTPGPAACQAAEAPKVELHMDEASATNLPWIDANGWRFLRAAGGKATWCYKTPAGAAALAAAEAYAYGVNAVIAPDPADLDAFAGMSAFLRSIDQPALPTRANIGIVDDGSDSTAEVLNLLARRNLLFKVVKAADAKLDLNLTPKDVPDPHDYAVETRQKLGDDRRLVRLFGTQVAIAHLTGDATRLRLHVLNYSRRDVTGLRVRVLGDWKKLRLAVYGRPEARPSDIDRSDGGTEFSIESMGAYAIADLER
jgi:hypothetical protein